MNPIAQTVAIERGNIKAQLPLLEPTLGPAMIDTRRLREETGYWAYDPSFGATGACRSAITYVDGDEGVLLYRGYPIDQLVDRCITSKYAGCCSTANCRARRRRRNSSATSPTTRWSTSSCT